MQSTTTNHRPRQLKPRKWTSATGRSNRSRTAAVVLELIVALPVLLILLLATVEFGVLISNLQQVALASRVGAEEASQTGGLSMVPGPVPANVLAAIDQQLGSSGITRCRVILQHNVGGVSTTLISGGCDCLPPATPLPASGEYVRVTVCTELTELAPNCLAFFGFDISGKLAQQTTTFRHEL